VSQISCRRFVPENLKGGIANFKGGKEYGMELKRKALS
jgi:hypothetical protein